MATINPFQGPIDYSSDVQSPFEASIWGFKIGASGAEAQAQRQAQEKAQTAQTEVANLFKNPNATAKDYARVATLLPKDQAEGVRKSFEMLNAEQQQNRLSQSGQVYSAMQSGQPEIAKSLLQQQAEAFTASGRPDEAKAIETYIKLIDLNPAGAKTTVGLMLAGVPGGKEMLENIDKTLATSRVEAEAPSKLREQLAKASKAETDALVAVQTATDDIAKAKAQRQYEEARAESERVKAKYAEKTALADLEGKGAQLGLTKAQTGSALAQGQKLGAEAKTAIIELEALKKGGTLATPKAFEQEEKLRKEFQLRTKVYGELGGTFNNIKSSADAKTGPGDIALITGFMKMLDPGSVVRETEFATARDTAGLYTRLENSLKKAETGQFLQPNQRSEFVNLAKQYLDSAQKKAGDEKKALGVVVKNYRLNPENVFGPETEAAPGGQRVVNPPLPTGTPTNRNVTVDY